MPRRSILLTQAGLQLTAYVTLWFSRMCWGRSPVRHGILSPAQITRATICTITTMVIVRLAIDMYLHDVQLTSSWDLVGQGFNEQRWLVPTDSFDISWLKSDVFVLCKAVSLVHIADWLLFVQAACENGWQCQELQTAHWTPWRTNFELFISAKDKSETHWLSPSWRPFFPEVLASSSRHASVRKLSQWWYSLLMYMCNIFFRKKDKSTRKGREFFFSWSFHVPHTFLVLLFFGNFWNIHKGLNSYTALIRP